MATDAVNQLAYLKKHLFFESGVLPSQIDNEDYFEILEISKATEPPS